MLDKPITEFTDKELADMVRQSMYLQHTVMGDEQRFLMVLAVPYGQADHVTTEEEAFEEFFSLVQDDDYKERNIVVYDHKDGSVHETSLETIEAGDGTVYACQNCEWMGPESEMEPIDDVHQRVAPGEPMPAGECPECGAVCHKQEAEDEA